MCDVCNPGEVILFLDLSAKYVELCVLRAVTKKTAGFLGFYPLSAAKSRPPERAYRGFGRTYFSF